MTELPFSVTPNSFTVAWPPCSVPSSASICWKTRVSRSGSKSTTGGRSHACSFSALFSRSPLMPWLSFSSTSVSNVLFGWLDASLPIRFSPWELFSCCFAGDDVKGSSRRFLAEDGAAGMLRRALDDSPSTRFCGKPLAVMASLRSDKMRMGEAVDVSRHENRERQMSLVLLGVPSRAILEDVVWRVSGQCRPLRPTPFRERASDVT